MTNQKLIEEAAERAYPDTEWSQTATLIAFRDAFARGWRESEKAQTPTDDEREALTRVVGMILGESDDMQAMSDDAFDNIQDSIVAAALADGFRRSEVTEPSAQRIGCNICGKALPDGEPHLCSEPQGEPSDAELAEIAQTFDVDSEVGPGTPLDIFIQGYRAALRAAWGTR